MSDWEIYNENASSPNNSDWELVKEPQKSQSFGSALLQAGPKMYQDALGGISNFIGNIPSYYESAKTEIPGLPNALFQHPIHSLGQGIAGLAELGHGVLNTPHNISNYISNRLNLIPQSVTESIPYQKDISGDLNQLFGQPQYPGESLLRGLSRNSLNLLGAGAAVSLPFKLTAGNIAKGVIKAGEKNKIKYSGLYNNLFKDAKNQGYGDLSHIKPEIDIKSLRKFSPKKSIEGVEDFMKDPTLENAHQAKSDLLGIQRKLNKLTTFNTAERKHFNSVSNAIDTIQNNLFKGPEGINTDLLNKYNQIQKGYASNVVPYKNNLINRYKRQEITANELINKLNKGEFRAKKGSSHPQFWIREKIPSKKSLGYGGLGLGGYGLSKYLVGNKESK